MVGKFIGILSHHFRMQAGGNVSDGKADGLSNVRQRPGQGERVAPTRKRATPEASNARYQVQKVQN